MIDRLEVMFAIMWICFLLIGIIALGTMWYLEYKDWQDTKQLIRDNNGTCIDKGYAVECGYSTHQTIVNNQQIISSSQNCFSNGIEVNCSEILK